MDATLFALYIATIDYGLTLPDCEVIGYYVAADGTEHDKGQLHAVLRWLRGEAESDPTAVSPWALVSASHVIAEAHDHR